MQPQQSQVGMAAQWSGGLPLFAALHYSFPWCTVSFVAMVLEIDDMDLGLKFRGGKRTEVLLQSKHVWPPTPCHDSEAMVRI